MSIQDKDNLLQIQSMVNENMVEWALQKTYEYAKLMSYYKCAMMEIETKFNVLNEEFSLQFDRQPINSIKTRLKNPISIRQKLSVNGYELSLDSIEQNLHDVAGIRVVCSFIEDVYMLAEALLKQDDITLIETKDYIKNPKGNGYRSLHLIVAVPIFLQHEKRIMRVEIQLRTIAMDSWASLEHQLRYKKDITLDEAAQWELRYCADLSAQLDERMNAMKKRLDASLEDSVQLKKNMGKIIIDNLEGDEK